MSTIFQIEPETREAYGKNYSFVPLNGCLDEKTLPHFSTTIEPLIENDHTYLVFDLKDLDLISSHAVSYFKMIHQRLGAAKKQMVFVNTNEEILEILEFIGLVELIAVFDVEEKFLEAIKNEEI